MWLKSVLGLGRTLQFKNIIIFQFGYNEIKSTCNTLRMAQKTTVEVIKIKVIMNVLYTMLSQKLVLCISC